MTGTNDTSTLNARDVLTALGEVEEGISFYVRHMGGITPGQEMGFARLVREATGWGHDLSHRFVVNVVEESR